MSVARDTCFVLEAVVAAGDLDDLGVVADGEAGMAPRFCAYLRGAPRSPKATTPDARTVSKTTYGMSLSRVRWLLIFGAFVETSGAPSLLAEGRGSSGVAER